jgi:anti-anti-sigma factor
MQITRVATRSGLELQIAGRLDSHWADHLSTCLADTIREGHDRIALDLSGVTFLSSPGIAVLMRVQKQLTAINGRLLVTRPSTQVRTVLEITRLAEVLIARDDEVALPAVGAEDSSTIERPGVTFHVYGTNPAGRATCRAIGAPFRPGGSAFTEADSRQLHCPVSVFALGLGAFGDSFNDCRDRYGEFLAVGGTAACLPADGTSEPDYVVSSGARPPDLQVLHALVCEGPPTPDISQAGHSEPGLFARLARFEGMSGAVVPLDQLVEGCLELAGDKPAGIVFIAEVSGLVGAAWRRSPAMADATGDLLAFPDVRRWLSFTAERAFARTLALVVGVAAPTPGNGSDVLPASVVTQLRPLTDNPAGPKGHFHAAVFAFRPFRKGRLDLKETVTTLFESESLMGMLHLLNDDRPGAAAGQSEFSRGVCWIAPIQSVVASEG